MSVRRFLKKIILKLIYWIEKREFKNLDLDPTDPSKKIISSHELSNLEVLSDTGFVPATHLHFTQPYEVWFLETANGLKLDCADLHIVFTADLQEKFVADLQVGDLIMTEHGPSAVTYLENTHIPVSMVDLSIDHPNHRYYTNGVLSHNTITSSIFLLWYLIFNFDKNAMILANVGSTAEELMEKIKAIIRRLPFFLKPGIITYNVMTVKFDNNCRIMAKTTTKTSSIGFTIHFLYMDEFAHINPTFISSFFRSVFPTISSSQISRVIITSTPNGQNKFYEIYSGALAGENEFHPIRVDWWQVPGRDEAWRQKEIANLGSEDDFNQEYGNQFLASSRLLLDFNTLKRLKKNEIKYVHRSLQPFEQTSLDYSGLTWHPSFSPDSLFEKDEPVRFFIGIDSADGGGGDYTVANIFKVTPLPLKIIEEKRFFENEADFFCLLQVGMFRSNQIEEDEFKAIMEVLCDSVLPPESVKLAIEADFRGSALIDKMMDSDRITNEMFVYTHHSEKAKIMKPGIKIAGNTKEKLCHRLKINARNNRIIVNEKETIFELSNFGEAAKGTYASQVGKDDIPMTMVNLQVIFDGNDFNEAVSELYDSLPDKYKTAIEKRLTEINASNPENDRDMGYYKMFGEWGE